MAGWRRIAKRALWTLVGAGALAAVLGGILWHQNRRAIAFLSAVRGSASERSDLPADAVWKGAGGKEVGATSLYLPVAGEESAPVLVVAAGVTKRGVHDPRVWKLLLAFRAAGFSVLCPEVGELVRPGEAGDSVPDIVAALREARSSRLPRADGTRIGLVGVSVGGAIALKAAAEDAVPVKALLLVGVPDDVRPLARTWFESAVAPKGATGVAFAVSDAGIFARHVILETALPALVPASDVPSLRAWIDAAGDEALAARKDDLLPATAEGRRFRAAALAEGRIADEDFAWVTSAAKGALDRMSPAAWGDRLAEPLQGTPCFLVHGRQDALVPLSEMDALAKRLANGNPVRTLASDLLTHVDVGAFRVAETWRHVRFLTAWFDAVRGD